MTVADPTATPSVDPSPTPSVDPAPTPSVDPVPTPSVEPSPSPVITHRTLRKRTPIRFATRNVKTAALKKGVTRVKQHGRHGVRVAVYRITLRDGVESGRRLVRRYVARRPIPRIVLHGTHVDKPKPSNRCDPNYAGACVPIASDVDCAGGSGNGPAYVQGPVRVVGVDIYGLDSDGDGWGCE